MSVALTVPCVMT